MIKAVALLAMLSQIHLDDATLDKIIDIMDKMDKMEREQQIKTVPVPEPVWCNTNQCLIA